MSDQQFSVQNFINKLIAITGSVSIDYDQLGKQVTPPEYEANRKAINRWEDNLDDALGVNISVFSDLSHQQIRAVALKAVDLKEVCVRWPVAKMLQAHIFFSDSPPHTAVDLISELTGLKNADGSTIIEPSSITRKLDERQEALVYLIKKTISGNRSRLAHLANDKKPIDLIPKDRLRDYYNWTKELYESLVNTHAYAGEGIFKVVGEHARYLKLQCG